MLSIYVEGGTIQCRVCFTLFGIVFPLIILGTAGAIYRTK